MDTSESSSFIVVGIDGSEMSEQALRWAIEQARLTDSRVVAVTGFDVPWSIYLTPTVTGTDYARVAQERLDSVVDSVGAMGVDVERRVVQLHPAKALTLAAKSAELLVVGGHGAGGFPGMHLGSVATHCVHYAPCPVVVMRAGEE